MKAIRTDGLNCIIAATLSQPDALDGFTAEVWCRLDHLDTVNGAYPLAVLTQDGLGAGPSAAVLRLALGVRATTSGSARWTVFVGDVQQTNPVSAAEAAFTAPGGQIAADGTGFSAGVERPVPTQWTRASIAVDGSVIEVYLDAERVITLPTTIAAAGPKVAGLVFSMTQGAGFTATCDFGGGRLWRRRLSRAEVSASATTPVLSSFDGVAMDCVVDPAAGSKIADNGPATGGAAMIPVPADLDARVVDATAIAALPSIAAPAGPATPAQPPSVPEGADDRLLISHTLPDTVMHSGRRVVELAVALRPQQPAQKAGALRAAAAPPGGGGGMSVNPPATPPQQNPLDGGGGVPDDYRPARETRSPQDAGKLKQALLVAQAIGYLDPAMFPLMAGSVDAVTLAGVKKALETVNVDSLTTAITTSNSRLVVYPGADGAYVWRLVPPRTNSEPRPRLLLIETYTLSSFLGGYGAGRTLKTLTLLPGEKIRMQVRSYQRRAHTSSRAASVLDSSSREAESEFERLAMQEDSTQSNISSSFEYHADLEARGDATWGWGSASLKASGGVSGSSEADRETFGKSMTNALDKHTSRASSAREVSVTTADEVAEEAWEEADSERVLENINLSRTLNYVFRQMNQEYITVLHLTDVRAAYFDGYRESRDEVPLHQLETLLANHPDIDADAAHAAIADEIAAINRIAGSGLVEQTYTGEDVRYRVDPHFTSDVDVPGHDTPLQVPGVVITNARTVMRTDGVMVDAYIGEGNALDAYSTSLQEQEARRVTLENDMTAAIVDILRATVTAGATDLATHAKLVEATAMLRNGISVPWSVMPPPSITPAPQPNGTTAQV